MVARMMRWRPWLPAKKFRVRLLVQGLQGLSLSATAEEPPRVVAEVRWKGPKVVLSSLRRKVKRNRTREEVVGEEGAAEWNEEFESACTMTPANKDSSFHPWEISFSVYIGMNQGSKSKESVLGMALLNLADFIRPTEEEMRIALPLLLPGAIGASHPLLHLVISLQELRTPQDTPDIIPKPSLPVPVSPPSGDALNSDKDGSSPLTTGLSKVKILTAFVSTRHKSKKKNSDDEVSEGKSSSRSDYAEYTYPFDTDSLDDDPDEGEIEDSKEDSNARKSLSYGTLATANLCGSSSFYETTQNEDLVYYSHDRSFNECIKAEETTSYVPEQSPSHRMRILSWRKRKLSFRSPKTKGEPLLKKAYAEEGGDDIDYDRRLLSSSDEYFTAGGRKGDGDTANHSSSVSEFGDDNFVIGSWELKQLASRDGKMEITTQAFFASIDQRSEQAAGESACTVLVAVIADWFHTNHNMMPIKSQFDWFHTNHNMMPIKSQFDCLIRDGSFEWRNLCKNETYRERFPDKHFDLETVLEAKIRRLSVVPTKSFIGFFHPEGTGDGSGSGFDVLDGAMSFDSIWDEISRAGSEEHGGDGSPQIYIVSWNDHFFLLLVEQAAYYIVDMLGERFYEGCNQAYILKFDDSTKIHRVKAENNSTSSECTSSTSEQHEEEEDEEESISRGKESCKEYIKNFLAAIPIRELQEDIKKGRTSPVPLHHRLQIEFHYTESLIDDRLTALTWSH